MKLCVLEKTEEVEGRSGMRRAGGRREHAGGENDQIYTDPQNGRVSARPN